MTMDEFFERTSLLAVFSLAFVEMVHKRAAADSVLDSSFGLDPVVDGTETVLYDFLGGPMGRAYFSSDIG